MVGHLNVPALDPSGTPSSISKPIVTGLLREKLGYDGIIITDALNMYGVARDSGLEKKDIPLAAYKAGVDILLMPEDVENAISQIENALEAGEITMEGLDMRVKKMLRLKARYGIFDKSYDPIVRDLDIFTDTTAPDARMKAKLSLIKKVSEETMTVVFNDNSQGLGLPVLCKGKKVAYVGFRNPQLGEQFGEIANRYGQVDTVLLGDDAALEELKAAKEKVSGYDLVIFGFNKSLQSIKRNFGLEEAHLKFITDWAADQPMVAVFLGSPYILKRMPGHENFKAFVVGYDANRFNNEAAAKVVFGVIPAKGILPVTTASFKVGEGVYIPAKQK
jgi:beta-glucosidase-like glycosyl hydrolase